MTHASPSSTSAPTAHSTPKLAMAVVTTIFFMWGFLTCLNDILMPHLKSVFTLNYTQAALVQFTFFGAYFLMALPAGRLVARLGYKNGIVAGLAVAGVGALLFWPAAAMYSYPLFLCALFVLATGITALQVAANPYVALLGPEKTSSSRLNLSQAFNSLGTAIAPLFGGLLILAAEPRTPEQLAAMSQAQMLAYRAAEAQSVQMPYLGLGIALFALAIFIFLFRLPAITEASEKNETRHYGLFEPLRHRHVLLGVLGLFFYVGAEVSIGSYLVNYLSMPDIGAMSEQAATRYVSAYWTGAMVGRFIGSALLLRIDAGKLLATFAGIAAGDPDHQRDDRGVCGGGDRPVQFDHVPDHLHPGDGQAGAVDQQGLLAADHGHRRRRGLAAADGFPGRSHRPAARLRAAAGVLPVHRLLRPERVARARAGGGVHPGEVGAEAFGVADRRSPGAFFMPRRV